MPAKQAHTRVNISLDIVLLKQVDWLLEVRTRNRSQLIEDLLEEWVYMALKAKGIEPKYVPAALLHSAWQPEKSHGCEQ